MWINPPVIQGTTMYKFGTSSTKSLAYLDSALEFFATPQSGRYIQPLGICSKISASPSGLPVSSQYLLSFPYIPFLH